MADATPILDNIRAEMARRRLTQNDVAQLLGLPQASVSKRLTGVTPLEVHELLAIAGLLDIPPAQLLEGAA